jgi:hypothetical protein
VTYELPQEQNRRARKQAKKNSQMPGNPVAVTISKTRKLWNLTTYKFHSIGHYPDAVVEVGTTDS